MISFIISLIFAETIIISSSNPDQSIYIKQKEILENFLQDYANYLRLRTTTYELEGLLSKLEKRTHHHTSFKDYLTSIKNSFKINLLRRKLYSTYSTLHRKLPELQIKIENNQERKYLFKTLGQIYVDTPNLIKNLDDHNNYLAWGRYHVHLSDTVGVPLSKYIDLCDGYYFLKIALDNIALYNPGKLLFDSYDLLGGLSSMLEKARSDSFSLPNAVKAVKGISLISSFYPASICAKDLNMMMLKAIEGHTSE